MNRLRVVSVDERQEDGKISPRANFGGHATRTLSALCVLKSRGHSLFPCFKYTMKATNRQENKNWTKFEMVRKF